MSVALPNGVIAISTWMLLRANYSAQEKIGPLINNALQDGFSVLVIAVDDGPIDANWITGLGNPYRISVPRCALPHVHDSDGRFFVKEIQRVVSGEVRGAEHVRAFNCQVVESEPQP